MKNNVIQISNFFNSWKEVCAFDAETSTLQFYVNKRTGEIEVVQMNDDGEVIRTQLSSHDSDILREVLSLKG